MVRVEATRWTEGEDDRKKWEPGKACKMGKGFGFYFTAYRKRLEGLTKG